MKVIENSGFNIYPIQLILPFSLKRAPIVCKLNDIILINHVFIKIFPQ